MYKYVTCIEGGESDIGGEGKQVIHLEINK